MGRPRLAVDEDGVVHVNILRYGAWALCERRSDATERQTAEAPDRAAPTCLWCVVAFQRNGA